MILISVFDGSGKLLRNGTGFFVSADGRFITGRSVIEGGSHAVAKTSDGRIHNVNGILADAAPLDLAVLKAQPKQPVAFFSLNKASSTDLGTHVAIIGNPLTRKDLIIAHGTLSAKRSDQNGEAFELSTPIPTEALGAPAITENGEVVGVITHGAQGGSANILRATSALNSLLTQITPATKTRWQLAGVPGSPAEGPSPAKPKGPSPSPRPSAQSRLVYSPAPGYPSAARHSSSPSKGSGRFRITFGPNGEVKNVSIVQSTQNAMLDQAAVETLRKWKAQPGPEWTANVPISFQP
jgi:serine protease Do